MSKTDDIRCLSCKKGVNFMSSEPEFYCIRCVGKGEIHNSVEDISPVKWYHHIRNGSSTIQNTINIYVKQIRNIIAEDRSRRERMLTERVNATKVLVEKMRLKRDNKIIIRDSIAKKRKDIFMSRLDLTRDVRESQEKLAELSARTLEIQIYLNRIQCVFVEELFHLLPIKLSKYAGDSISELLLSASFSPAAMLETDDNTASAVFLLALLETAVSFVLDLHPSSMDLRQYTVEMICRRRPLTRDDLMAVYDLLARMVHHIMQATLRRLHSNIDRSLSSSSFSAQNYPLNQLSLLRTHLKKAFIMDTLSNPYVLHLDNIFANPVIEDFSNCARADRLNGLSQETNIHDFVEISCNVPFDQPLFACASSQDEADFSSPLNLLRWLGGRRFQ